MRRRVAASWLVLGAIILASPGNQAPAQIYTAPAEGRIEVAFSPDGGAQELVCRTIGEAKRDILVAAYSFTNRAIAKALADATARGVRSGL